MPAVMITQPIILTLVLPLSEVVEDPRGGDALAGLRAGGDRGAVHQVGQRQVRPRRVPPERRHGRHSQSR